MKSRLKSLVTAVMVFICTFNSNQSLAADIHSLTDITGKGVNIAPTADFSVSKRNNVDVLVLTDYSDTKRAELSNIIADAKVAAAAKGINLKYSVVNNSKVKIGRQSVNITNHLFVRRAYVAGCKTGYVSWGGTSSNGRYDYNNSYFADYVTYDQVWSDYPNPLPSFPKGDNYAMTSSGYSNNTPNTGYGGSNEYGAQYDFYNPLNHSGTVVSIKEQSYLSSSFSFGGYTSWSLNSLSYSGVSTGMDASWVDSGTSRVDTKVGDLYGIDYTSAYNNFGFRQDSEKYILLVTDNKDTQINISGAAASFGSCYPFGNMRTDNILKYANDNNVHIYSVVPKEIEGIKLSDPAYLVSYFGGFTQNLSLNDLIYQTNADSRIYNPGASYAGFNRAVNDIIGNNSSDAGITRADIIIASDKPAAAVTGLADNIKSSIGNTVDTRIATVDGSNAVNIGSFGKPYFQPGSKVFRMWGSAGTGDGYLLLQPDGNLVAYGCNAYDIWDYSTGRWAPTRYYGIIGGGDVDIVSTPKVIAAGVKSVKTAQRTVVFVKTDGTLWGFGYNASGILGSGTYVSSPAYLGLNYVLDYTLVTSGSGYTYTASITAIYYTYYIYAKSSASWSYAGYLDGVKGLYGDGYRTYYALSNGELRYWDGGGWWSDYLKGYWDYYYHAPGFYLQYNFGTTFSKFVFWNDGSKDTCVDRWSGWWYMDGNNKLCYYNKYYWENSPLKQTGISDVKQVYDSNGNYLLILTNAGYLYWYAPWYSYIPSWISGVPPSYSGSGTIQYPGYFTSGIDEIYGCSMCTVYSDYSRATVDQGGVLLVRFKGEKSMRVYGYSNDGFFNGTSSSNIYWYSWAVWTPPGYPPLLETAYTGTYGMSMMGMDRTGKLSLFYFGSNQRTGTNTYTTIDIGITEQFYAYTGKPLYAINLDAVKLIPLRPGAEKYLIIYSDGKGVDTEHAEFGSYFPLGNLKQDFIDYLKSSNFNVYIAAPGENLDIIMKSPEIRVGVQTRTIRDLLICMEGTGKESAQIGNGGSAASMLGRKFRGAVQAAGRSVYLIVNEESLDYKLLYDDFELDPKYAEQWKFDHDPSVFENNNGLASFSGQWISTAANTFDKTGKYTARVKLRDNPKNDDRFDSYRLWSSESPPFDIYAHHRPIADFSYALKNDGGSCTLIATNLSYDPDHFSEAGRGIVSSKWQYKLSTDVLWTSGLPAALQRNRLYQLKLEVQDREGAWSHPAVKDASTVNLPPLVDCSPQAYDGSGPVDVTVTADDQGENDFNHTNYAWTQSTARPSAWSTSNSKVFTAAQAGDGNWYLHMEAFDNAGNSNYIYRGPYKIVTLAVTGVSIRGYWNHWRGQVDMFGKQLTDEPHRFLSLETVKVDVSTTGNADKVVIRFSPELEAMQFTDTNGNVYDYRDDYFGEYVIFPQNSTISLDSSVRDNHAVWEYSLPLAPSSKSWDDARLRGQYSMTVTAYKGERSVVYTVNDIDITGNVYDLTYIQPIN